MKPLRLEFTAFGSYPGREVVDFEVLGRRGLFVVTGPTGTGKTTVLDAMVFALFGELPGARSSINDLRSHFAGPEAEASVTFDFEVDGTRYRVTRAPKQERPKQRGTGTTTAPATATLMRVTDTGTESIATRSNDCSARCAELIGLDAARFQRVVLLPQGRFTDFLLAKDADRESLLRELFGGHLYEVAIDWLKRRVTALRDQLGDTDNELVRLRGNVAERLAEARRVWDPEVVDGSRGDDQDVDGTPLVEVSVERRRELIGALEPRRATAQAALDDLRAAAADAASRAATAADGAVRFDAAFVARQRLAELEASRTAVDDGGRRADRSARARPVVDAHEAAARAEGELAGAQASEAARRVAIHAALTELGHDVDEVMVDTVAGVIEQAQQRVEADAALMSAVAAAQRAADAAQQSRQRAEAEHVDATAAADAARTAADAAVAASDTLRAAAAGAPDLDAQVREAADRVARRDELTTLEAALAAATADADRHEVAHLEVMARFVATQAPRLAQQLVAGEPCPVCGSAEHPMPARDVEGDAVDQDAVDAARMALDAARGAVATRQAQVAAVRGALGTDADADVADLQQRLAELDDARQRAQRAVAELVAAEATAETALADSAAAGDRLAAAVTALALASSDADRLAGELAVAAAAAAHLDAVEIERRSASVTAARTAANGFGALVAATASAAEAARLRRAASDSSLADSGFGTVDEARAALLDTDDEQRLRDDAEAHATEVATVSSRLGMLDEQGVPDERPDVAAAEAERADLAERVAALSATVTTAINGLVAAAAALDEEVERVAGSAGVRAEYDDTRLVLATCSPGTASRIPLDRWVLAGELDRVTTAANVHLARMTGHRYRLSRDVAATSGLTLEVFDAHNGRTRPPASLSGGEQFQASLSLALGLADVVSLGGAASGRQFEALFVDEGFGSLDPDSLDEAISALSMLQASGRMVGAITHVEAMKQRLHVGIEVHRRPDGRGSTLTVNP